MTIRFPFLIQKRQMNKFFLILAVITSALLCGCGQKNQIPEDGIYLASVTLSGGTGKASIESPADVTIQNGSIQVKLVWSSVNYDYMIVNGEKYLNENKGDYSTFTIPISSFDEEVSVIADTTAMSIPHEIEYTICVHLEDGDQSSIKYDSLQWTDSGMFQYATQLQIEEYLKYRQITIAEGGRFLLVPENMPVPKNVPKDIVTLQQPLNKVYLVSSSVMDLVRAIDGITNIRMSGVKEKDWYINEAVEAMKNGDMLYAGKYNAPDYEMILNEGCNLAVENTMIYHNPEVKEKLEELGIPVLVEKSSYESHPLGRLEWIKLYGVLFQKEEAASHFFDLQVQKVEPLLSQEKNHTSVAFFYVTSNGAVSVRKPNDYIAQMIGLAGGEYILNDWKCEEENALSTMNIQMEEFYSLAKDADVLIYNSTIEGELKTLEDLEQISPLFADFKAIQNGTVYCTSNNFFQRMTGMCDFMEDLNSILTNKEPQNQYFIKLR